MQTGEKPPSKNVPLSHRPSNRTVHMAPDEVEALKAETSAGASEELGVILDSIDSTIEEDPVDRIASALDQDFMSLDTDATQVLEHEEELPPMNVASALHARGEDPLDHEYNDSGAAPRFEEALGLSAARPEEGAALDTDCFLGGVSGLPEEQALSQSHQEVAESAVWGEPEQISQKSVERGAAASLQRGVNASYETQAVLVGFLVSFDNDNCGTFVELRSGRLVVTSEPFSSGTSLVIQHPTVSPMHAVLRIEASGQVQILDQLSEHGTRIRRVGTAEELLSGDKSSVCHGDVVMFGACAYHVCLISKDVCETEQGELICKASI